MTPAQIQLARRRLVLGITNVGFWVLAALGSLAFLLVHSHRPVGPDEAALVMVTERWMLWETSFPASVGPGEVALVLLAAVAVQAGFDLIGGTWLMPPPVPTTGRFLRGWLRGVCVHTLLLAGIGSLSYVSFRLTGSFVPAIVLATAALALARRWLLLFVGGVAATNGARHSGTTTLVARADDPAFTGGVVGWGSRARNLLPASWLRDLPPDELAAESSRRTWQMAAGLPGRAILFVLGWNVLGAVAGSLVLGLPGRPPAAALLLHACWMTLWTFGSLLLLPSLSRKTVFAADRAAQANGHDPQGWIAHFPALVGEDGGANPLVQTIFYPVPFARLRLSKLAGPPAAAGFILGNLARTNLYYSWAACTLLGRAVHCNVGRPALWVFPPSA